MAYQYEKSTGDLIFDGWERGIATSPHKGIGNIQCGDISTIPGEVMCNYARVRQTQSGASSGTILSSTASTITLSVGVGGAPPLVGNFLEATSSTITNLASGSYWWIKTVVDNHDGTYTLTLSTNGWRGTLKADIGTTGTAFYRVVYMGKPIAWAASNRGTAEWSFYVLDAAGFLWVWIDWNGSGKSTTWEAAMASISDTKSNTIGNAGLFCYGGYVIVATDQLYFKSQTNLKTAWTAFTTPASLLNAGYNHTSLVGHDSVAYICDTNQLASLTVIAGKDQSYFDPTNSATYTFTDSALVFPETEISNSLAELGTDLIIGCWSSNLYRWNRTPISIGGGQSINSFFYPVILPETYVQQLLTVNNLVYVFCGSKGNVYVTNGTTVSSVLTIPDYVTQQIEPYFIWGGVMFLRGRIWFSVQDSNSKAGGVWSFVPSISNYLEQDTGVGIRLEAQNTYNTYAGMATLLFAPSSMKSQYPNQANGQQALGAQYWAAWDDGSAGAGLTPYGIDYSATTPYINGQTIVETDLVSAGEVLGAQKKTFSNCEFKLAAPLAANESVVVNFRTDLTSSFTTAGTVQMNGVSGVITPSLFAGAQWIQLEVILTSTTTTPSFVRLVQIRLRTN